ncbi:hypothetical protein SAY87_032043 [Trapa incisa]|uniref:60S ribosomal protein L18a-like protein n=1 Tax=Trapa incisa TaxID=236973 RepID=A0AAN7QMG1_9MYRT|nr:hypothetical protein SAY87_032043 [Trapa incisa]
MSKEEDEAGKSSGVGGGPPPHNGAFQGVANHPPPSQPPPPPPAVEFPQPVPPPAVAQSSAPHPPPAYVYGTAPGYAVAEGTHVTVRQQRLPCFGLGCGWSLFIIGFFLGAIPWYAGALILFCGQVDPREKPGYMACTIAAVVSIVAVVLGATSPRW